MFQKRQNIFPPTSLKPRVTTDGERPMASPSVYPNVPSVGSRHEQRLK